MSDRMSLKMPAEPGVRTLVTPDSQKNLPSGDREKEVALPPGSATPNSPSEGGGGGDGGRNFPKYEENTPNNGIPSRPRTLPTPGEDYGHPVKYDYNTVTRRPDVAASAMRVVEAYTRTQRPGQHQHKQRGQSRLNRRQHYRRNRTKEKMRARIYYKRNKKNPQFRKLQQHRRKFPQQHKRRMASALEVAAMYWADTAPSLPSASIVAAMYLEGAGSHDWNPPVMIPNVRREHRQHGDARMDSKRDYVKNKSKKKREMNQRNKRLRTRRKMIDYKEWYNAEYHRHKKRPFRRVKGEVLTSPQIAFAIGRDMIPGVVRSVSPMTAMVTFSVSGSDVEPLQSMLVVPFLRSVVFLSEGDIDAFFDLVDVEVGPEAYADFNEDVLRDCATQFDVDVDTLEFADQCLDLVGETDFATMTPDQLEVVTETLVLQVLDGGGRPHRTEDNEYDWHLYYGEVPEAEEFEGSEKVAEGITFTYEVENPKKEIDYPDDNALYEPTSPSNWKRKLDDKNNAPGHGLPETHQDDADAPSSRVLPRGEGEFSTGDQTYLKAAATLTDLGQRTGPAVHASARKVTVRLKRADPQRGFWTFDARGSKGESYIIRVKGQRTGNIKELAKAQVLVSCSCNFFRWQGPEHWAKTNSFLYGKPRGTASTPVIKDPTEKHWACKHVLAALNLARKYRFSSSFGDLLQGEIMPEYAQAATRVASVTRVAHRWLKVSSERSLEQFKRIVPIYEFLVEEAKTIPPIYGGMPGNYYKSPAHPQVGMYGAYMDLLRYGREWGQYVIDHKAIPSGKAKPIEMAVRVLARVQKPKDFVAWFEENKPRFQLLTAAEQWPDRSEESGIKVIGPFRVHDTIGASEQDWEKATRVVEKAQRELSKTGLSNFPGMAYGELFLVGQLGRKNWAAWYMPAKDAIYLRPNIRGVSEEESSRHLIHELGHRFWAKSVPADKKSAWLTHHMLMSRSSTAGRIPDVGEILPVVVNNKKVRVQAYEGGQAVLVDATSEAPVGKVPRSKLWGWMAEVEHKMKFPSLYAVTDAEEHFCEALSLKATGKLTGPNLEAFNRIFG